MKRTTLFWISFLLIASGVVAVSIWPHAEDGREPIGNPPAASQKAGSEEEDAKVEGSASESTSDGSGQADIDPVSLREKALASWQPWSNDILRKLHSMHPADLIEFLDDDELLQHDDARSLVEEIYGACGVYLGLLASRDAGKQIARDHASHNLLNNPGGEWCARMSERDTPQATRDRLTELLEVSTTVDPAGTPRRQVAFKRLQRAQAAGSGGLMELLDSEDPLTASLAVEALWKDRNQDFLDDWERLESLSAGQQQRVMTSIHTTLECQQMGDCSVDTLAVGALCLSPAFQCDGQIALEGVLYQSLSRIQLDAYYQLINRIRQYRAADP